jgi:hypothetical protein
MSNPYRIVTLSAALGIVALLSGCAKEPISTSRTDNDLFRLQLIFTTPEGCKVYRFEDAGQFRYLTTCVGAVAGGHRERAGKSSHWRTDEVQTTEVDP